MLRGHGLSDSVCVRVLFSSSNLTKRFTLTAFWSKFKLECLSREVRRKSRNNYRESGHVVDHTFPEWLTPVRSTVFRLERWPGHFEYPFSVHLIAWLHSLMKTDGSELLKIYFWGLGIFTFWFSLEYSFCSMSANWEIPTKLRQSALKTFCVINACFQR